MFELFTNEAIAAVMIAQQEARNLQQTAVGSELLLLGLMGQANSIATGVLKGFGLTLITMIDEVEDFVGRGAEPVTDEVVFSPSAQQIFERAIQEARQLDQNYVAPEHLLLAIAGNQDMAATRMLHKLAIDPSEVRRQVLQAIQEAATVPATGNRQASERSRGRVLDAFATDLTLLAARGKIDPVIGREQEIERVVQILGRRSKNNPILVGEPGVGKTAIAEGLAQRIVNQDVPDLLVDRQVLSLNLGSLVAGTGFRGDFEQRLTQIIAEVKAAGNIILVIDEVHTLVGAGAAAGGMDAANLLKPALARGDLQCIGATTLDEYRQHIESDTALARRFQPVMVDEPTVDQTVEILRGLRSQYEQHHQLKFSDVALEAAARLSDRYIRDRYLPDKAIDLIDEAGSLVRLQRPQQVMLQDLRQQLRQVANAKAAAVQVQDFEQASQLRDRELELEASIQEARASQPEAAIVDAEHIAQVVTSWTGIPIHQLTAVESANLLKLENTLHQRLIGQDDAIKAVARAIRRARVGLKAPDRPIASFLFCGPTGVGKTELTKALAASVFGSEEAMIRLDMSEYMEPQSVAKLIGSPPGYVGYGEGGQLTEAVRRQPYTVLLLDEIEKAHPDVFNLLLQLLDEGRLTDSQGRVVDFQNTLTIMTSNIGAQMIEKRGNGLGFMMTGADSNAATEQQGRIQDQLKGMLNLFFRPEFLNRLDDIIIFRQLQRDEVKQIADVLLNSVAERLSEQAIQLELTEAFKERLVSEGYDPTYGARPLRRAIARLVEDNLAEAILAGRIQAGDTVVFDINQEGQIQVQPKQLSVHLATAHA
jgi:ATP-dependent Clp protease ATP-binding subunit ClpC